jgi:hypothetical protein
MLYSGPTWPRYRNNKSAKYGYRKLTWRIYDKQLSSSQIRQTDAVTGWRLRYARRSLLCCPCFAALGPGCMGETRWCGRRRRTSTKAACLCYDMSSSDSVVVSQTSSDTNNLHGSKR